MRLRLAIQAARAVPYQKTEAEMDAGVEEETDLQADLEKVRGRGTRGRVSGLDAVARLESSFE